MAVAGKAEGQSLRVAQQLSRGSGRQGSFAAACGTWGHLGDLAALGSWLDSMVPEGFSSPKDSMILSMDSL